MKSTRRFLRYKRYLARHFMFIWTVPISEDGVKGERRRRMVHVDSALTRSIYLQLDKMKCALRIPYWQVPADSPMNLGLERSPKP